MGLDMYLTGKKTFAGTWGGKRMEDGLPVERVDVALGYWRKHPNLHGYIVANYARDGEDNCEPIELTFEQVNEIIDAIKEDRLTKTDGFFFGSSPKVGSRDYEEQKQEDLSIFGRSLMWYSLDHDPPDLKPSWKTIVYCASW